MKTMKKTKFAIGTSLAVGISGLMSGCATTSDDALSSQKELSSGYMNETKSTIEQQGAKKIKDGSCGEGKCGSKPTSTVNKAKAAEGKCGEGKCGDKKMDAIKEKVKSVEGKCGEGKCGEGKCGGSKK